MTKKVLLASLVLGIIFFRLLTKKQISDKDYALQVLDQYIRYYCPNAGTCAREKALERLRLDWPNVYKLGFSVLEENE